MTPQDYNRLINIGIWIVIFVVILIKWINKKNDDKVINQSKILKN